jgi:type VI protein secretion system component Hcp
MRPVFPHRSGDERGNMIGANATLQRASAAIFFFCESATPARFRYRHSGAHGKNWGEGVMASDFFLKFDDFHKFESFEDEAEGAAHALRRLGRNSVDLGGGFLKLIHDGTTAPSDMLDLKFKHDDAIISHDFFKLGFDFLEASASQHKVDIKEIVIIKVIDKSSPNLSAVSEGGGGATTIETDLPQLEADLKITGQDFLKIAPSLTDAPAETLSLNFSKISFDYKEQGADELKVGQDFITLAKNAEQFKIRGLSDALFKYGQDAVALGNDYLALSADFQKISQDFSPTTTAAITTDGELKFNQGVLQNPADFVALAADLKVLNADLRTMGGDTLKLSETLETAAHQLLPAVQKG